MEQTTGTAVHVAEADGTWFTTYAEHKYKLPPDLLCMLRSTWGCWWESQAPTVGLCWEP